ncbi:MAG TPA: hypothetical protein PLL20_06895 [Phycisphaerae bacterium]|nr:hypothetical protein [Phycisphaerae bacterium]HRR84589.1 hypothetical protein [Phycisphaerae bacterium]
MSSTRLTIVVLLLASCGLYGCAPSRRPSPAQVDDFINRRAFVISAINDIKDPMPGTSYSGISENYASDSEKRIKRELEDSAFLMEGIRQEIDQRGSYVVEPGLGIEFDVDLSEQLTEKTDREAIARQLNHYYVRKLEKAGWYVGACRKGGVSPGAVTVTYIWTDRGKGSHTYSKDYSSMSLQSTFRDPEDYRRGFFHVLIAVRVDTDVNRAHVAINYWGRIG